jgi:hypothetical protein
MPTIGWFVHNGSVSILPICNTYLPVLVMALGGGITTRNIVVGIRSVRRQKKDPERALALLQGFRRTIIGLSVTGLGAAWFWDSAFLFGLSLIIVGEELLESTVMISALKRAPRGDANSPTYSSPEGSPDAPTGTLQARARQAHSQTERTLRSSFARC